MTENEKYLKEAREGIKDFQAEQEPERLREAYMAAENVNLAVEHRSAVRRHLRAECLSVWLRLLQLLDSHLDPSFDLDDLPDSAAQPPPTSDGVLYGPGADPALIDDPKARAEYERAIAAARAKASDYRLQVHLGRLNERILPRVEKFIREHYTDSPGDQKELKAAIEKVIEDPRRKASLLKLLTPPPPESDDDSP